MQPVGLILYVELVYVRYARDKIAQWWVGYYVGVKGTYNNVEENSTEWYGDDGEKVVN